MSRRGIGMSRLIVMLLLLLRLALSRRWIIVVLLFLLLLASRLLARRTILILLPRFVATLLRWPIGVAPAATAVRVAMIAVGSALLIGIGRRLLRIVRWFGLLPVVR